MALGDGGPTGEIAMKTTDRQLMWLGMLLFLLGLLTGLAEQRFTNVRMGLAAHLEGVMDGMFLVALGAIWTEVRLPSPAKAMAYWTALYGTYVNWLTTTLAAVFGTAAKSPISAAGYTGQPWQENLVTAGFLTVSLSIIAASALVLWGLRPGRAVGSSWSNAAIVPSPADCHVKINRAREFSIPLQILIGSIAFAGASQSSTATTHSTNVSGRATASSGLRSQAKPQSDSISAAKIMAMESTR